MSFSYYQNQYYREKSGECTVNTKSVFFHFFFTFVSYEYSLIIICSVHYMITIAIQLEHHSQYVTWCVCITEYYVWYRDNSQAEIDEIPEDPDYRVLTLEKLLSATRGCTVTHMCIRGDVPPLGEIAPHVKQLQLHWLPDRDQSDRSVDRPPHTLIWVCSVYEFWKCQESSYHAGFCLQMRPFIKRLILSHSGNNVW